MVRYLRQNKKGEWEVNPPFDAIKAEIATREVFDDEREARKRARKVTKDVNLFRRGKLPGANLDENSNLSQLVASYLNSVQFASIKSQDIYELSAKAISETPYKSRKFGDVKLKNITSAMCGDIYTTWVKHSVPTANYRVRIFSVLMTYAMANDAIQRNPMAVVKKVSHTPKSTVWTRQQVTAFVEECFKDFKYRSLGLLALMCYEWAQRPTDIANMKWESVDWDKNQVHLIQSKRSAEVFLPIDPDLKELLEEQHKLFDFQELVVPYQAPDKGFKPYTPSARTSHTAEILKKANLPDYLQLGTLRKTAITEMREAGLDQVSIRNITGHKNLQSLDPYMVNTLKSAVEAQRKRKETYSETE